MKTIKKVITVWAYMHYVLAIIELVATHDLRICLGLLLMGLMWEWLGYKHTHVLERIFKQ